LQRVAFFPDGDRLLTGSGSEFRDTVDLSATVSGGVVQIWDLRTGQASAPVTVQPSGTSALALAPDGTRLVTSSRQSALSIWRLDFQAPGARDAPAREGPAA